MSSARWERGPGLAMALVSGLQEEGAGVGGDAAGAAPVDATLATPSFPRPLLTFAAVATITILVVGVLGNLLTVVALLRCPRVRNVAAAFIISLCVADLVFCALVLPFSASRFVSGTWVHGDQLCQLFPLMRYGNVGVSLLSIAMITINRYIMIAHHGWYGRIYRRHWIAAMIAFCWLFSYGMQLPTLLGVWGRFGYDARLASCSILADASGRSSKTALFVLGFLVPCVLIVACYARIFWVVHHVWSEWVLLLPQVGEPDAVTPVGGTGGGPRGRQGAGSRGWRGRRRGRRRGRSAAEADGAGGARAPQRVAHHQDGARHLPVVRRLLPAHHHRQGRRPRRDAPRAARAGLHHAVPVGVPQPHHLCHHEQAVPAGVQDGAAAAPAAAAVADADRQQQQLPRQVQRRHQPHHGVAGEHRHGAHGAPQGRRPARSLRGAVTSHSRLTSPTIATRSCGHSGKLPDPSQAQRRRRAAQPKSLPSPKTWTSSTGDTVDAG